MTGHAPAAVLGLSLFAYALMAAIAMATAGLIALLVAGLAATRRAPAAPAVATPAAPSAAIDPATVAAIAAAIRSMPGAHHIVWIGETRPGAGWTDELRRRHHQSHHPRPHR